MEEWKVVPSIPRIEVSNKGNVRCAKTGRKWYTRVDKLGYVAGQYAVSGKKTTFKVHRLVATTFLENPDPENMREVNHIDCNKQNNSVDNLEWCTRSHNMRHAIANNLANQYKGEKNPRAVLTEDIVIKVCEWFQESPENTPKLAVELFNISMQQATKIRSHRAWKHITENYEFIPLRKINSSVPND